MKAEDIEVSLLGDEIVEIGKGPPAVEEKRSCKRYRQMAYSIVSHS